MSSSFGHRISGLQIAAELMSRLWVGIVEQVSKQVMLRSLEGSPKAGSSSPPL